MRVLVTGIGGQLGYDVVKVGRVSGHQMMGPTSKMLDITDEQAVRAFFESNKFDAIIHCAAYTAVDHAEDDQGNCHNVNVNGTKYLAEEAKAMNAKLIYISTDYVFNGEGKEEFTEMTSTGPTCYYGETKLQGENSVKQIVDEHFIVRISWVFGVNGHNFIKTMLKLAETRDEVNVVGDQIGSPTYTADLAELLISMLETEKYGVYHASNEGFCSWADLAKEIFKLAGKSTKVNSISTSEYPTKARRPLNSRMSKDKLLENGFTKLPPWQDALKRYLKELEI